MACMHSPELPLLPAPVPAKCVPASPRPPQVEVEDPSLQPGDIERALEDALRLPGEKKRKTGSVSA